MTNTMPQHKRPLKVFLCHSSSDKKAVRALHKRLNVVGWIEPWLDEENLLPGQDWDLEIRQAIKDADAILVILSSKAITKEGYVQKEIKRALDIADEKPERTIYIIPTRLEECDSPERLQRWHRVDLFDTKGYERLLTSLQKRASTLNLEVYPTRKTWIERLLSSFRKRKETFVSTLGILIALLALLFGDNIYEQFTGHSIFANNPAPATTRIATFTLTSQPAIQSQPIEDDQSSNTPTITTKVITPTITYTPTSLPIIFNPHPDSLDYIDSFGVPMRLVPSGIFTIGTNDILFKDERPASQIYLDSFYLDKFEVTNALYKLCVDAGICELPTDTTFYNDLEHLNHPVVFVNWDMARTYCEWRDGRLPTEAQWEKAARGTDGRTFPWGESIHCSYTNYSGCINSTSEVGKYLKDQSVFGVFDLGGNVGEWTSSLFTPYPYDAQDGREDLIKDGKHVIRGGDWNSYGSSLVRTYVRSPYRTAGKNVGFRCTIDATP